MKPKIVIVLGCFYIFFVSKIYFFGVGMVNIINVYVFHII